MTFTSIFVIVVTSGVVFAFMGYSWGKKDAQGDKSETK